MINLKVGDILYGFCNGLFGKFYGDKVVEAVGEDWVVVREGREPLFANFLEWEIDSFNERLEDYKRMP